MRIGGRYAGLALLVALSIAYPATANAADGWLSGANIEQLANGNTARVLWTSSGQKGLAYFAPDHRVIMESSKGNPPFYIADWSVQKDEFCIQSRSGVHCSDMKPAGDHFEGWSDVDGKHVDAFEFTFYPGDPADLMGGFKKKDERDTAIVNLGTAIIGELFKESLEPKPKVNCDVGTACAGYVNRAAKNLRQQSGQ